MIFPTILIYLKFHLFSDSFPYLGFAVPDSEDSQNNLEVNRDALNVKGFQMLMTLFEDRTDVSELYYLLFALLLGYPITGNSFD